MRKTGTGPSVKKRRSCRQRSWWLFDDHVCTEKECWEPPTLSANEKRIAKQGETGGQQHSCWRAQLKKRMPVNERTWKTWGKEGRRSCTKTRSKDSRWWTREAGWSIERPSLGLQQVAYHVAASTQMKRDGAAAARGRHGPYDSPSQGKLAKAEDDWRRRGSIGRVQEAPKHGHSLESNHSGALPALLDVSTPPTPCPPPRRSSSTPVCAWNHI